MAGSMRNACARCSCSSPRCRNQVSWCFWGQRPAICPVRKPRRPTTGRWGRSPRGHRTPMWPPPVGFVSPVMLVPMQMGQGTFVLDTVRVASHERVTEVAVCRASRGGDGVGGTGILPCHSRGPLGRLLALPGSDGSSGLLMLAPPHKQSGVVPSCSRAASWATRRQSQGWGTLSVS